MEYIEKYEQKETSKDHLTFSVDVKKDKWQHALGEAIKAAAKDAKIKGFKDATKAPISMIRQHVDMVEVYNHAIETLLNPVLNEVIIDSKIVPLIVPGYNPVKITDDELSLTYDIVLLPTIKLGKYKGLKAEKPEAKVSEEEIDHALEHLLEHSAVLNVVERPVQDGDTAVIDFEGFLGKKAFEGGKAENHELKIGSNSFIPGFEEQIIGHAAGEKFDIQVTFPEDYQSEELKGKEVTFKIVLHEVKEEVLPKLDDEFAKSQEIEGVATLKDLRAHQKKELLQKAEDESKNIYIGKILELIVEKSEIPVYEEYIQRVVSNDVNRYAQQIEQQVGGTLEDYLKMTGTDEKEFLAQLHENAIKQYKVAMVVNDIITKEKIFVTDEDVDKELSKMAEMYGMELPQLKQILASQIDQFRNELVNKKFEEFILSNN